MFMRTVRVRSGAKPTIAALALVVGASCLAHAQEAPPLVSNTRQGYAFEFPRVLAEQRLFGIAHGVALLADACHDDAAVAAAYAEWRERQHAPLETIKNELAVFYYGTRAGDASWENVAGALNLRTRLDLAPAQLQEACASLPQALQEARYDIAGRLRLEAALAQTALAIRVETQNEVCATRLPESSAAILARHYATWQSREGTAIADAHARLNQEWAVNAMSGEAEDVRKALHHKYSNPPQATCEKLADWLDTPAATIEQAFAPAPPPAATSDTGTTEMPVTEAVPESSQNPAPLQMPETPAEIEAMKAGAATQAAAEKSPDVAPPNIFDQAIDHVLKFFKESANEQQRPSKQPGH